MVVTVSDTVTAKDVLDMLQRHYERQTGIWAPEIASPCGKRRADLIWLERRPHREVAPETPGAIIGHEIKVTRADLRAELADPTKWEAWRFYVDRWWLVVPDTSLLAGFTLPDEWGVLTRPSGRRTRTMTMTIERPAVLMPEQNRAAALMRIVKWQDNRVRAAREQARNDSQMIAYLKQQVETLKEVRQTERDRDAQVGAWFANMRDREAS